MVALVTTVSTAALVLIALTVVAGMIDLTAVPVTTD